MNKTTHQRKRNEGCKPRQIYSRRCRCRRCIVAAAAASHGTARWPATDDSILQPCRHGRSRSRGPSPSGCLTKSTETWRTCGVVSCVQSWQLLHQFSAIDLLRPTYTIPFQLDLCMRRRMIWSSCSTNPYSSLLLRSLIFLIFLSNVPPLEF